MLMTVSMGLDERFDHAILGAGVAGLDEAQRNERDTILKAFAFQDTGADTAALELLQSISRTSPAADWKLFLRGLIAHHAEDHPRREANWNLLDPLREAAKWAARVRAVPRPNKQAELTQAIAELNQYLHSHTHISQEKKRVKKVTLLFQRTAPELLPVWQFTLYRLLTMYGDQSTTILHRDIVGPVPHDPNYELIAGLALSMAGVQNAAALSLLAYVKRLTEKPDTIPLSGPMRQRLLAKVLLHLAECVPEPEEMHFLLKAMDADPTCEETFFKLLSLPTYFLPEAARRSTITRWITAHPNSIIAWENWLKCAWDTPDGSAWTAVQQLRRLAPLNESVAVSFRFVLRLEVYRLARGMKTHKKQALAVI
ncbi:MAG: hypothetical protein ACRCZF_16810, partial [Gemmataceae bacterium]